MTEGCKYEKFSGRRVSIAQIGHQHEKIRGKYITSVSITWIRNKFFRSLIPSPIILYPIGKTVLQVEKVRVIIYAKLLCQHYVAMLSVDFYAKPPTWLPVTRCLYTKDE